MKLNLSVFDEFPVLKTKRLTLRAITPEDGKAIYKMRSSGRVNEFIARPPMQTAEQGLELAQKCVDAFKNKQGIPWSAILRNATNTIGTCGFNSIDVVNLHAEIGGEMATEYWGKGIAQEAVTAIIDFGLNTMNLQTIEAKVSPNNRGAIYILEQTGFEKEAHFKNRIYFQNNFLDMAVYTLHMGNERLSSRKRR